MEIASTTRISPHDLELGRFFLLFYRDLLAFDYAVVLAILGAEKLTLF